MMIEANIKRWLTRCAWRIFLRCAADWQIDRIGEVFGHTQGWLVRHVKID